LATKNAARQRLVSKIAAVARHNGPDDPRLNPLRAELHTEALAEHIRKVVDGWPPLTAAQREKLALLLNPGAGHGS
jgi:hypothetical protein